MNSFDNLKEDARLWVFQSNRILTENECGKLKGHFDLFLKNWQAHGKALKAEVAVEKKVFLLIAVDESVEKPSGCSIDAMTHQVREIGGRLDINFFDRLKMALEVGGKVEILSKQEVEQLLATNQISAESICYNSLIQNIAELRTSFKIPFHQSWMGKQLALT